MENVELQGARAQVRAAPRVAGGRRRYWRETMLAYLFLAPAALLLFVFSIRPLFYAFYMSLNTWSLRRGPVEFIGLANYQRLLQDDKFWNSLIVTFYYVVFTVPVTLVLGLLVAYLLFQGVRGLSLYRTLYFLPFITSLVAASTVWATIFNPQSGFVNNILTKLGLAGPKWLQEPNGIFQLAANNFGVQLPEWAAGPSLALVTIMIFVIWQRLGYDIVIYLAGLSNIPKELYEAARIDGAGSWQLFRHITVPLLSPTIFFLIVISTIGALQAFTQIVTMNQAAAQTKGGPLDTTMTTTIYLFRIFYGEAGPPNYSYATAMAFVLFLIILGLTLLQRWGSSRWVHYS
ncbi:MAG: sugar ABC transporter permease [Anaerolineae bacterium]